MRVAFRFETGTLSVIAPDLDLDEGRPVNGGDADRFGAWAATYRALLAQRDPQAGLLALGRDLYGWLDGPERWLERLLDQAEPPLVVEFQAVQRRDATARRFLQVPWELLADNSGHLARDESLCFAALRRVGRTGEPPAPSDLCLGLTFMAAAPRTAEPLDFEAEESAILTATGNLGLDLVVEESGNPGLLAERLIELEAMQVLHLSCHGRSEPEPMLLLEDQEGGPLDTTAAQLLGTVQASLPRLLFVSACQSAAAGSLLADPLAMTLIRAGVPAVLGWDGSVHDHEATAFAHALYERLSLRRPLEETCAEARRALLNATDPQPAQDWHLARLWLGRQGGGTRRRRMLAADFGHKAFLDARRQQSPGPAATPSSAAGASCRPG